MMQKDYIEVDNKRFHYIWLRDNCPCEQCREPGSFQKLYDYSKKSLDCIPASVREDNEYLIIAWDETPAHESSYSKRWLRHYAYDSNNSTQLHYDQVLWDTAILREKQPQFHNVKTADRAIWLDELFSLGFTLLKGFKLEEYEDVLKSLGPIHPTEYGDFATVRSVEGANDLAESGYAITPHTDYSTYMYLPPLVQFLYCVENEATGGESILVDGLKVAADFRSAYPMYFDILTTTPIEFQQFYTDWRFYFRRKRPIIELNEQREVTGIFFGHSHCYNWQIPFEKMKDFYKAYQLFFNFLKDPAYQFVFRLNKGKCIITWNSRTLHGRKAFSSKGRRHLEVSYILSDHLLARRQFQKLKHLYIQ